MSSVPIPLGKQLTTQSPWFVTAILVHVVVIAVASILWFGQTPSADDDTPAMIVMRTDPPPDQFVPVEIVDRRDKRPELEDLLADPSHFESSMADDVPCGDVEDPSATEDVPTGATMIGDLGGSTSIGLGGPGWYSNVPSPFTGRPGTPGKSGKRGPGRGSPRAPVETEAAVDRGLEWLRKHQDGDGRWDADGFMKHDASGTPCTGPGNGVHDVGVTGLALLAFLGRGHTLKEGQYRHVLRKGVRWLVEQQDTDNGRIGEPNSHAYAYSHAIATLAVCEAYGLSSHRPLQAAAQNAVNYIANARNPYGVWRYEPRSPDGDTSVTAWMVQALLSAKEFGLAVDDTALRNAAVWFDGVTDVATGPAGYTRLGEGSSRPAARLESFPAAKTEALTGAVLLCRCLMEQDPAETPTMALAAQTILKKPPVWNESDGSIDMCFWYYATYALFQMGGTPWAQWSKKIGAVATRAQRSDDNANGSWDPVDAWGGEGGRVYSTAVMVLVLQAPYRYGRVLGAR